MHQETMQSQPLSSPRFRPYASPNHHVTKGRYITSNDARGYIPVYEYPLNGQWIMMDIDDGYILWTGIWKALGHSKADIVKMVDSQPDLAPLIRRVRGGYLKIQGTWMPYEVALRLSRRVAWSIRDDLIPLFGPTFPSTCLSPDQPGFGQVVPSQNKRRARRNTQTQTRVSTEQYGNWNVTTEVQREEKRLDHRNLPTYSPYRQAEADIHTRGFPTSGPSRYAEHPPPPPPRYAPYPPTSPVNSHLTRSSHHNSRHESPRPTLTSPPSGQIVLPPIQSEVHRSRLSTSAPAAFALPPISALEDLRGISASDTAAVLRRLRSDSDDDNIAYSEPDRQVAERMRERKRSFSIPPSQLSPNFGPYERRMPQAIHLSIPSSASSNSTSTNASPISPATPQSSFSHQLPAKFSDLGLVPLPILEHMREQVSPYRSAEIGHLEERQPVRPW